MDRGRTALPPFSSFDPPPREIRRRQIDFTIVGPSKAPVEYVRCERDGHEDERSEVLCILEFFWLACTRFGGVLDHSMYSVSLVHQAIVNRDTTKAYEAVKNA